MGGDRSGPARVGRGPHRIRQDPVGVPVVARPAAHQRAAGEVPSLPGPLRLAAEGPRGRRRAQPPGPAHRHPPHRRAARGRRTRGPRRGPLRRHLAGRPPQAHHLSPGHHDHDARVAVPDADLPGPRVTPRRRDRHRRRGARRRRHQARRPPRRLARTPRCAARPAGAADRPVCHGPASRGGRAFPRRHRPRRHRRPALREALGPQGGRPGRGHDRPRRVRRGVRRPAARQLDLAPRRGARRRPDRRAPLDHRLRQLPPAGRAADRPAQRDRGRPGGPREARRACRPLRSWPSPGSPPARRR